MSSNPFADAFKSMKEKPKVKEMPTVSGE